MRYKCHEEIETDSVLVARKSKPEEWWHVPWFDRVPLDITFRVLRQI